jgi:peptidoglycan/xylan/chitin deacetylase (PgdA/CDA1 family)
LYSQELTTSVLSDRPTWPPILLYHAITPFTTDPNDLCVPPVLFEDQMHFLKRHNLRGVSMRELLSAASTGNASGLIGLTFDDGYEHLLQTALPVLERLRFSCTIFVPTAMLGRHNIWDDEPRMRLLDPDHVRELSKRGIEIASHGARHIRLPGLSSQALDQEVSESRQVLGDIIGEEVKNFCYPYGNLDSRVIEAVQRAGYAHACTALEGVWWDNPYAIPRIFVGKKDGLIKLRVKLWSYPKYAAIARMHYAEAAYTLARRVPFWRHVVRRLWYR